MFLSLKRSAHQATLVLSLSNGSGPQVRKDAPPTAPQVPRALRLHRSHPQDCRQILTFVRYLLLCRF